MYQIMQQQIIKRKTTVNTKRNRNTTGANKFQSLLCLPMTNQSHKRNDRRWGGGLCNKMNQNVSNHARQTEWPLLSKAHGTFTHCGASWAPSTAKLLTKVWAGWGGRGREAGHPELASDESSHPTPGLKRQERDCVGSQVRAQPTEQLGDVAMLCPAF